MGKFRQFLTELSARDTPIFSFPDDNLSKCQGILTKFGTCIDINPCPAEPGYILHLQTV